MEAELNEKKKAAFQVGVTVLVLLAAFTIGEYFIGSITIGWSAVLALIALIKAFFIVRDYMHVSRLFSGDEEAH